MASKIKGWGQIWGGSAQERRREGKENIPGSQLVKGWGQKCLKVYWGGGGRKKPWGNGWLGASIQGALGRILASRGERVAWEAPKILSDSCFTAPEIISNVPSSVSCFGNLVPISKSAPALGTTLLWVWFSAPLCTQSLWPRAPSSLDSCPPYT